MSSIPQGTPYVILEFLQKGNPIASQKVMGQVCYLLINLLTRANIGNRDNHKILAPPVEHPPPPPEPMEGAGCETVEVAHPFWQIVAQLPLEPAYLL